MRLDIGNILHRPGSSVPFETEFDYSWMQFGASQPAQEPVLFTGTVRNEAGVILLDGSLQTKLHCICDRCASAYTKDYSVAVHAMLVAALEDEEHETDSVFCLEGDFANLSEIAEAFFVLNMDAKFLCKEDCKGLCPQCGKNLNLGPCSCKPEPDPRLAVLAKLLDQSNDQQ